MRSSASTLRADAWWSGSNYEPRLVTHLMFATVYAREDRTKVTRLCFLAALFGLAFGFWQLGLVRLNPTSTLWLMQGDPAQHFLGWHFFRSDDWRIPPGANPRYGLDMGSSIVFTDSIPLLALPAKALSPLLPIRFQYAGPWMLLSFVLQGVFAVLLLRRFIAGTLPTLCGALLLITSSAMIARTMGHFALTAHWIILASLWLYFAPTSSTKARWGWCILLPLAVLVHGYLFYFAFGIWLAASLRRLCSRDSSRFRTLLAALAAVIAVAIALWGAGWFAVSFQAAAAGDNYGKYAANLAALFNPVWLSPILPIMTEAPTAGGLESVNYLGGGTLFLLCALLIGTALRPSVLQRSIFWIKNHIWLILLTLLLSLLAFSHRMYWGELAVLQLPLPTEWTGKLEFIRGSGRLLWLAHYLLMVGAVVGVVHLFSTRTMVILMVVAVGLQLYERGPAFMALRSYLQALAGDAVAAAQTASLRSPFWNEASKHYDEVAFFPITHAPPRYEAIAQWAGDHQIGINAAYFGRVDPMRAFAKGPQLERELTTASARPRTLYVLLNAGDASRLKLHVGDGVGMIDGHLVVAPQWFSRPMTPAIAGLLSRHAASTQ
jgi:Family of unknown function (DUF6311)